MGLKTMCRICVLWVVAICSGVHGNNFTDGDINNHLWNSAGNWSGSVPVSSDWCDMTTDGTICIIDTNHVGGNAANGKGVYIGTYGGENEMKVTGGELYCEFFNIGRGDANSGSEALLEMTGGLIHTTADIMIPNQFGNGAGNITGHVDLFGGTLSTDGSFYMGSRISGASNGGIGSMDITDGTLVVSGNKVSTIQSYIDNGWITFYGQSGVLGNYALDYGSTNSGKTTLTAVSPDPPAVASILAPTDGAVDWLSGNIYWVSGAGAQSHNVYFGTTNPPPFIGNQPLASTNYKHGVVSAATTYYWRIDEVNNFGTTAGVVWSFDVSAYPTGDINGDWLVNLLDLESFAGFWLDLGCSSPMWCGRADISMDARVDYTDFSMLASEISASEGIEPPFTDYNAMLSQEIQGKKHGFMAGNLTYYIGGRYGVWDKVEDETLGLTHPFYHDLRSRGTGMVFDAATGYGHDMAGGSWDFYQFAKVAYGTVIVGQTEYANPVPTAMYWQPDKMICEYSVGGVTLHEEKFIAANDAACTIITSSAPVTLKFKGQSFWSPNNSVTSTASVLFDAVDNQVRISEGGTANVKTCDSCPEQVGTMVYDGMTTVLSSDKPITGYSATSNANNQWFYEFNVACDTDGVAIVWSMADVQNDAIANADLIVADPAGEMADKSDEMNDILNYEIPYFRCSDQDIVDVYYYLWAINLMYYIDVNQGLEIYPHTQSAVNNFMGMHRYDAVFQIRVGAWAANKERFANGNALIWSGLLSTAQGCGMVADNMGIGWHSGIYGPEVIAHVPQAWLIYEHSGDLDFLSEAYAFYKPLFWGGVCSHWGYMFDAAESLGKMALALGHPEDVSHWHDLVNLDNIDNWLDARWDASEHMFLPASPQGWTSFAYMGMTQFPDAWAKEMTEHWAIDAVDGFFSDVPLAVRALKDWNTFSGVDYVFVVTPDTNWYAIRGMYMHHVGEAANTCALGHLKEYNMEWGIPVAPESYDLVGNNLNPWGDQYSNFNAGKILLVLEGMSGISYSVVDDTFTVADHMPLDWDFMEFYIPINTGVETSWTRVRTDRVPNGLNTDKTVIVENNTLATLKIEPWLDEKVLFSAPAGYVADDPNTHVGYTFIESANETVTITLED